MAAGFTSLLVIETFDDDYPELPTFPPVPVVQEHLRY
jgi:hypothetical protein